MTKSVSTFLMALFSGLSLLGGSTSCALDEHARQKSLIDHVFIIVLENEGYEKTFGASSEAPFLSKELTKRGVLLTQYFGTGHVSLDNYIAMISGQAATIETRTDCLKYEDFSATGTTPDGQAIGHGCVYPVAIKTLPDQLSAKVLSHDRL
jgi:phosphatidylinositol-3-phosphatase